MYGPQPRVSSPWSGSSILITAAPMAPSINVQKGPATTRVRSRTRIPLKGGMPGSLPRAADGMNAGDREVGDVTRDVVDGVGRERMVEPETLGDGVWPR